MMGSGTTESAVSLPLITIMAARQNMSFDDDSTARKMPEHANHATFGHSPMSSVRRVTTSPVLNAFPKW